MHIRCVTRCVCCWLQDSFPWSSQSAFASQSQPWAGSQAGANHPLGRRGGHLGSQVSHLGGHMPQAWPATQASQGPEPLAPPEGIRQVYSPFTYGVDHMMPRWTSLSRAWPAVQASEESQPPTPHLVATPCPDLGLSDCA